LDRLASLTLFSVGKANSRRGGHGAYAADLRSPAQHRVAEIDRSDLSARVCYPRSVALEQAMQVHAVMAEGRSAPTRDGCEGYERQGDFRRAEPGGG